MKETHITIPELGLVAATRAALGAGIGLLVADRLTREERRAIGWTLFAVGALTTIPLAFEIFGHARSSNSSRQPERMPPEPRPRMNERQMEFADA
jgi:hypothetical protein